MFFFFFFGIFLLFCIHLPCDRWIKIMKTSSDPNGKLLHVLSFRKFGSPNPKAVFELWPKARNRQFLRTRIVQIWPKQPRTTTVTSVGLQVATATFSNYHHHQHHHHHYCCCCCYVAFWVHFRQYLYCFRSGPVELCTLRCSRSAEITVERLPRSAVCSTCPRTTSGLLYRHI